MSNYWIGDASGRVLGPLTLQALRDLIGSGRLKKVNRASRDGTTWVPIENFDEVKDLIVKAAPSPAADQENAERIRTQLRILQGRKTPHEVFGMLPTANLDELRLAFFRMAKRFSPEHLGPETHPELRRASQEMFDFLSAKMREAESGAAPQGTPARGTTPVPVRGMTPVPVRGPPPGSTGPFQPASANATQVRKQVASPSYTSDEFVGLTLRTQNDQVHADIQVTPRNVGMFVTHRMINLTSGGLFIHSKRPLKVGTKVMLKLNFEQPQRTIELRTTVIWEHALDDGKQPVGYGLGLGGLRAEEKTFIQEFVRTHHKD
ncbi:MAG TPA: TIGR02266 family protein [Myxococcaceae bacterium]|jgi:uncharacterized protein (TIGR02266 family)